MKVQPPPARQLNLGFLPNRPPGTPDWGAFPPARQAEALEHLARLIAQAARPGQEDTSND